MATNTVPTFTNHTGNGSAGPFNIGFNYIDKSEVIVTVNEVLKSTPTHYTFNSNTQITFTSGNEPASGLNIGLRRSTNITTAKVDFEDGSVLTETDLDANTNQLLFALQENTDALSGTGLETSILYLRDGSRTLTGNIVFEGSTKDAHETTLTPIDPTADRTINIPNISGTLVTTGDTGTVNSTMIVDGTIANIDINNSAAIAGTKISPNFGSQNIITTGNCTANKFFGDGSALTGIDLAGNPYFLRSDVDDEANGNITFDNNIKIPKARDDTNAYPNGAHGDGDSSFFDKGQIFWNYPADNTVNRAFKSSAWMFLREFQYFGSTILNPELNLVVGQNGSNLDGRFAIQAGGPAECIYFDKDGTNIVNDPLRIHHSGGIQFEFRNSNPSLTISCTSAFGLNPTTSIYNFRGQFNITGDFIDILDKDGNKYIKLKSTGDNSGEPYYNGSVELYSENTKRFETNHTGGKIYGVLEATGSGSIVSGFKVPDNPSTSGQATYGVFTAGSNDDLEIYHDSINSYIKNSTGNLILGTYLNHTGINLVPNAEVSLYYANSKKLETTSTGITITGTVNGRNVATDGTKLDTIATNADVTSTKNIGDLANVNTSGVSDGKILKYQASSSSFIIADDTGAGGGSTTFTGLSDTPSNFSSSASKVLKVNSAGNAVEFTDIATANIQDSAITTAKIADDAVTGDKLANNLDLPDNNKIRFGSGNDLHIFHDGSNSIINDDGTGELQLQRGGNPILSLTSGGINITDPNGQAICQVTGFESSDAILQLVTDEGDDNGDAWRLQASHSDNTLKLRNNISGSHSDKWTISTAGDVTQIGHLDFPDSKNIRLGDADDLQLYHDGTHSYLVNDTGALYIKADSTRDGIQINNNGKVALFYQGDEKFRTSATGTTTTGISTATGPGNAGFKVPDSPAITNEASTIGKFIVGTGDDLTIYHNGTDSFIRNDTGNLTIEAKSDETGIKAIPDGAVELYYDGAKRLETISSGAKIEKAGTAQFHLINTSTSGSNHVVLGLRSYTPDGDTKIFFGTSADDNPGEIKYFSDTNKFQIRVNGTNTYTVTSTEIQPNSDNAVALGTSSKRFTTLHSAALNTGDIHMSNLDHASGNEVNGTKGSWSLQEGADDLFLINRVNGKKYKFNLTEIN
tara:strand:- start:1220 stop:4660 length:3441 start_codon:yes stop_codon:yes gene_type:complete